MGNSSIKGAAEVPVSFKHPWGVNGNIKMNIPLDFANDMRKDGTALNTEYKNFLAHKTYELIPDFINNSKKFRESYHKFAENTLKNVLRQSTNVVVEPKILLVKMPSHMLRSLNDKIQDQKYINNSIHDAVQDTIKLTRLKDLYDRFLIEKMKLIFNIDSINLYRYPNLLDDHMHDIMKDVHGDITYSSSPYLLYAVTYGGIPKTNKQIVNPDGHTWESYIKLREDISNYEPRSEYNHIFFNKSNLEMQLDSNTMLTLKTRIGPVEDILNRTSARQGITLIPLGWISLGGGHATTLIVDSLSKVIYITDSSGVDIEAMSIEYFLKKNNRFHDYKMIPIMPQANGPGFQEISQDAFCQTWTLFIGTLVVINHLNVDIIGAKDLNDLVFTEIIKYAKPLVGYDEIYEQTLDSSMKMKAGTKLGLIIIEYMFYIYKFFKSEFETYYTDYMRDVKQTAIDYVDSDSNVEDLAAITNNRMQIPMDDPNYDEQYENIFLQVYRLDKKSEKLKIFDLRMHHYSYSDTTKSMIKKITEKIDTQKYTSYQLVKAIVSGKI